MQGVLWSQWSIKYDEWQIKHIWLFFLCLECDLGSFVVSQSHVGLTSKMESKMQKMIYTNLHPLLSLHSRPV